MTDLTEQWKKGELPEGFYYVTDSAEVTIDYYICDYWERHFDSDIQQVLAPVPSYTERQAKDKENTKLKIENKWYSEQLHEAVKHYDNLKELLKGAREVLKMVDTYMEIMIQSTAS